MSDDDYNAGRNAGVRAAAQVASASNHSLLPIEERILALLRPETGSGAATTDLVARLRDAIPRFVLPVELRSSEDAIDGMRAGLGFAISCIEHDAKTVLALPREDGETTRIDLPQPTQDQREYLESVASIKAYDPEATIGGPRAPSDSVSVPREPTTAMIDAGMDAFDDEAPYNSLRETWAAMLRTAPASPSPARGMEEAIADDFPVCALCGSNGLPCRRCDGTGIDPEIRMLRRELRHRASLPDGGKRCTCNLLLVRQRGHEPNCPARQEETER
jgi:hypothetical protein